MASLVDTLTAVADPNRSADQGTETMLRTFPLTTPFAQLSDSADFFGGNVSSPAPQVGGAISIVRQFDDVEGGGTLDGDTIRETFGSGTDGSSTGGGGGGLGLGPVGGIVLGLGGFLALIVAVSAFFSGLADGVTS